MMYQDVNVEGLEAYDVSKANKKIGYQSHSRHQELPQLT